MSVVDVGDLSSTLAKDLTFSPRCTLDITVKESSTEFIYILFFFNFALTHCLAKSSQQNDLLKGRKSFTKFLF